jgi:amino acid adenylation domain-containing protein
MSGKLSKADVEIRRRRLSTENQMLLDSRLRGAAPTQLERTIQRRPPHNLIPLSYAQERLWLLEQIGGLGPAYNMPAVVRLRGTLNIQVLEQALATVVERHEGLRTRFSGVNGNPVQVIDPPGLFGLQVDDLSGLPEGERAAAARERIDILTQQSFDLERGPLFRVQLLRLSMKEHIAIVTMHHIVADGPSIGVLIQEVGALYTAFSRGYASPLAELPLQYADYAVWQRIWLQGEVVAKQVSYWKERLSGVPAVLDLPTDRSRPPAQSYRGDHCTFELPAEIMSRLNALAQDEGATLFMVLLAAFKVLLLRWTGQQDIVVGSTIAGRTHRELEGLIGFFVNTLVLRTDLGGNPKFRELLGRVRETALGAYAHKDLPFEKLVAELQPARDLSRQPVFQVLFEFQNASVEGLQLPDLRVERIGGGRPTAKFDLSMHINEGRSGLSGYFEYATDLFDAATIERLARQLRVLLEGIVADPAARLAELPLLNQADRDRLLVGWNDTASEYPNNHHVHKLFAEQALRTPDTAAVVFEGGQLNFGELDRRSNQLAHYLRELGVGPETVVGLCVERSPEMVVGLLGILKAGGAYLPLDPGYPQERLAYILSDSQAPIVITQAKVINVIPVSWARIVCLDLEWNEIEKQPAGTAESGVGADHLAYVIYTSGSTGKPKGVMLTHRGFANYVAYAMQAYKTCFGSGAPINTSISFDATVTSLFLPLVSAGAIWLLPDAQEIEALGTMLEARRDFSLVKLTPTHLEALQWKLRAESLEGQTRALVIGGEALTAAMVKFWRELAPGTRLFNEYGPTETVVGCIVHEVTAESPWAGSIPIGRPISNTKVYVLDSGFEPVPVGVSGELYIGGAGLARGYLGRADLTAERFVPSPYGNGERLYRSGDVVRWRADGELDYLGRVDHQVKLRGYRIELGEIEAAMSGHPAVRQVVVVVREDAPGDKRLVAYVVGDGATAPEASDLRTHLERSLPEYMVPSAFVVLEALPLTPNGKVDRQALPVPEARPAGEMEYQAPRTPTEQVLAEIWVEVLRVERADLHDNFFRLGGHSLLAMRMVTLLRERLGIELPLRAVFEAPVLGEFAVRVELARRDETGTMLPEVVRARRDGPLPLSFAQERLWVVDQLEPIRSVYNLPAAVRLQGQLDVGVLERAFATLVERHEVLRTRFAVVDGIPVQVIEPAGSFELGIEDLSDLPEDERAAAARQRVGTLAVEPFDLERGPMFRTHLLRLSADEHIAMVVMHHIVSDGWSTGILIREVGTLYAAFVQGQPSLLPPLPVQYADYATWQRGWLQGEILDRQLNYWRDRLRGAPAALELPTDRPRPAVQSYRGSVHGFALPRELSLRLTELSRREGVTLFMVLLAGFQAVLERWSGQTDIVVGTPIAGRPRRELEGLIGLFLNVLPLRTDLSGNPSFRDLLGRVKQGALEAYENQDVPFEKLVGVLQAVRDLSRQPVFQVSFTLQNVPQETLRLPGLILRQGRGEQTTAQLDLSLYLEETEQGLRGAIEYATDLFDRTTIERLTGHLSNVLAGIVVDPDARLSMLPLLGEVEHDQLVHEWNNTGADYPKDKCVHELFAAQAARTPDAVAVVFKHEQLNYDELDRRSNQVANYLQRLGVGPEVIVGLCVERSIEMVIGLLGIMKAGGAYLPLDPSYPQERLAFMLADSQAPIVVTHSSVLDVLPVSWAHTVCLDLERSEIEAQPVDAPESEVGADNLAYVIYTSGSTGQPKGTLLQHNGLCNLASAQASGFEVLPNSRVLQFASLNFDASIAEIAMAFCGGATLCLAKDILSADTDLARILVDLQISTVVLPPTVLPLLDGKDFPSLRTLVVAGEACSTELAAYWMSRCRFINAYGPTETTVCATFGAHTEIGKRLSIGRPMANTKTYVLDDMFAPVPVGVAGELYVGGVGLARGYLGRAGLTAERFVPSPYGNGERLYRTGDLVRWRADRELEFLGRLDHQVKLRGYRIELGEVEAALSDHPAVRQAVVVAREDAPGDKRLVAYVVSGDAAALETSELRAHLKRSLPEHMMPSAFVVLDALPLTPNGKVDRKALPASQLGNGQRHESIAPRNQLEHELAGIWQKVLGIDSIGVTDDFFERGGNSLLAIQLGHEISQRNYSISPVSIFTFRTIESLSQSLKGKPPGISSDCLIELKPGSLDRPLFLVHPVGGTASCYLELAKCVDSGQAIFGINAQGLAEGAVALESIEAMAANYIDAIRQVHPGDSYDLGGWSMGGIIAYEMARQLGEKLQRYPTVILIDSYFSSIKDEGGKFKPETLWHNFLDNLFMSNGETPAVITRAHDRFRAARMRSSEELVRHAKEILEEHSVIGTDFSEGSLTSLFSVFRANRIAGRRYVPELYSGRIIAFGADRADHAVRNPGDPLPLQIGPRLERHSMSSDHYSLLRHPDVETLGMSLTKLLLDN